MWKVSSCSHLSYANNHKKLYFVVYGHIKYTECEVFFSLYTDKSHIWTDEMK